MKTGNKKWKVAVVGCGGMGAAHIEALIDSGRAEIVSVVDIVEEKAREYKERYNAKRYSTDYEEEVRRNDIEIVIVTTIPSLHHRIVNSALSYDKNVLCEKPISNSLEGAMEIINAAKKSKGKVLIGHQLRYMEPWPTVIKELKGGIIGKPLVMRMTGNQQTFGEIWEGQKRLIIDTSPLIDCGVHYVDLMCLIVDCKAVSVYAQGINLDPLLPDIYYNYGLLQVKFADGSIGFYEAGWGPMMTQNAWCIKDFSGPKGSYSILYELDHNTPDSPPTVATYRLQKRLIPSTTCLWKDVMVSEKIITKNTGKGDSLKDEHNFFLDALENDISLEKYLIGAYESLKIVIAADRSIKENRVIYL